MLSEDWDRGIQDSLPEEVQGRLRFADPRLELKCKEELHVLNLITGTWTLLYINCAWTIALLAGVVTSRIVCGSDHRWPFALGSTGLMSWLAFLAVTTALLLENLRRPRVSRYVPLVLLYYFWFVVNNGPPFTESCEDYIVPDMRCELQPELQSGTTATFLARHRFDCSPEANTPLFSILFLLVFSPRIMRDFRFMWMLWLWLACVGFFLLSNRSNFRSEFFNLRETWVKYAILCVACVEVMFTKYVLEKSQRNCFISDVKQREASHTVFEVLQYMLPEHVLGPLLRHPDSVIADHASCVSILFIMIADFQAHASSMTPRELLEFLNRHFTRIDAICCEHKVSKIETIGEEYVAAVGVVPQDVRINKDEGHHVLLGRLLHMAMAVARSETTDGVEFKMGIHTGPIVAGVIGHKLPRFRLFGDTINTAARMMQKGVVGRCQFGEDTRQHLPEDFKAEFRGDLEMKGKGLMQAYLLRLPERSTVTSRSKSKASSTWRTSWDGTVVSSDSVCSRAVSDSGRAPLVKKIFEAERAARISLTQSGRSHSWFAFPNIPEDAKEPQLAPHTWHMPGPPEPRGSARPLVQAATVAAEATANAVAASSGGGPGHAGRGPRLRRTKTLVAAAAEGSCRTRDRRRNTLRKFTCLLEEVTDSSFRSEVAFEGGRPWYSKFLPFYGFFSDDMEQLWFHWFHVTEICEKLPIMLPRQITVFALLTVAECAVVHNIMTVWAAHDVWQNHRVMAFLTFRSLIFTVLGCWYRVAKKSGRSLRSNPRVVQWSLLFSNAFIGFCLLLSYDTLTQPDEVIECESSADCVSKLKESARASAGQSLLTGECWSLVFAVVYHIWMTWQQLLFHHHCVVVFITAALMVVAGTSVFRDNFYISTEAKSCFVLCFVIQATIAHTNEEASRSRYKTRCALEFMNDRIEDILNTLMPSGVVEELRVMPSQPPSHTYRQMTLAQSDLVGFTKLASTCPPSRVVEIVGSLFGRFDELTDDYDIYKIETVGDAYIAGQGGWPLTVQNSPNSVVLFALDMVKVTAEWASAEQLPVGCRVGVHSGECIGGVVGSEMQRYHIFGAIMSHLELLESTAPPGRVQVSKACFEAVANEMQQKDTPPQVVSFEERQCSQLSTSKGEIVEYHQVGGTTYLVVN